MKYNYVLKRSAARKSIGISLSPENAITVSAPNKATIAQIERFIQSKSGWLDRHMRKNEQINNAFSQVLEGRAALVKGDIVPFCIADKNSFSLDGITATSYSSLQRLYVSHLGEKFLTLFNKISEQTGLKCEKVQFRSYKSRWGCCNAEKQITFNYKLLMLPEDIWVYVIVHELSHTLYMDHSKAFYGCVASCLPDYKKRVQKLKRYSFVCRMY